MELFCFQARAKRAWRARFCSGRNGRTNRKSARTRNGEKPHRSILSCGFRDEIGRGERIRTSDPLVPNQVLYQAEPLPDVLFNLLFLHSTGPFRVAQTSMG